MIKFAFYLLFATALVVLFNWISENSGSLSFSILDYEISINLVLALVGLLLIVIFLHFCFVIVGKLLSIPSSVKNYIQSKRISDLIEDQLLLINQLLLNNTTLPKKLLKKIYERVTQLNVKGEALPLKLCILDVKESQSFNMTQLETSLKNAGSNEAAIIFKSLLSGNPGLMLDNTVLEILDAHLVDVTEPEVIKKYISVLLMLKKYDLILKCIKHIKRYLPQQNFQDIASITHYLQATEHEAEGELEEASKKVSESLGFRRDFTDALLLQFKLLANQRKKSALVKLIKNAYFECPSASFTSAVFEQSELIPPSELMAIAQDLLKQLPNSYEVKLLYVRCCLDVSFNNDAFAKLSELLKDFGKTKRVCILMSEFAYRTNGNTSEVIDWLKSALTATEINNNTLKFDFEKLNFVMN